jgi:hypothetical protein
MFVRGSEPFVGHINTFQSSGANAQLIALQERENKQWFGPTQNLAIRATAD